MDRHLPMSRRTILTLAASILIASACNAAPGHPAASSAGHTSSHAPSPKATPAPSLRTASSQPSIPTPSAVPVLRDGRITPGTYFYVPYSCNPPRTCSDTESAGTPGAPGIEVTVPSTRWEAATEFLAIWPTFGGSQSGALIMGWTNNEVGLNSEPCSQTSHETTDIEVGPSVDAFVEAVAAHPKLDITQPIDVELGGFSGRFFTLTTPADQSGCEEWRPWDPGFYAQGPNNIWDVWVMDVNGFRILIVADYFPQTSDAIKSELRAMAESIRFVP
jgi:hypothetical protein